MNRNFPGHHAEAMTQLHSSRILPNIRYSQSSNSSSEIPTKNTEGNQAGILNDAKNKKDTSSHTRHYNIPNALLDSMEEQNLSIA